MEWVGLNGLHIKDMEDFLGVDMRHKSKWSAPMWQAYVEGLETFEERKEALYNEVPKEMQDRVLSHLKTVRELKKKAAKKRG